jgi:hypothetical protein
MTITQNQKLRKTVVGVNNTVRVGEEPRRGLVVAVREDRIGTTGLIVVYEVRSSFEVRACVSKDWPNSKVTRKAEQAYTSSQAPERGSHWRHYKGGEYEVLYNVILDSTGQHYIVYRDRDSGDVWARLADQWEQEVTDNEGISCPRFLPQHVLR